MPTQNINDAILGLTVIVNQPCRALGADVKKAVGSVRHAAVCIQLGQTDGNARDLLKLALANCGESGVPLGEVSDLINAHQRANAGLGAGHEEEG